MNNKLAWAGNSAGIAAAAAKLSGDAELQSIIELLKRADMLGEDVQEPHALPAKAPLTGPAELMTENIFEKSFIPYVDSPTSFMTGDNDNDSKAIESTPTIETSFHEFRSDSDSTSTITTIKPNDDKRGDSLQVPTRKTRASLKRTNTDVAIVTMQNKLADALAKPYIASELPQNNQTISPSTLPLMSHSSIIGVGAHGHGNRWTPANQAVFTTSIRSPWTILAANDLACLMFGITKAEMRRIGIMEIVRKERHRWLGQKLKDDVPEGALQFRSSDTTISPLKTVNTNGTATSPFGGGVTAKLMNKPPSRYSSRSKKAVTEDTPIRSGTFKQMHDRSRGVIICGDVVPIQKRNGTVGSASVWLKEKMGILVWVLEEISEDMAYLIIDEVGCIVDAHGATEAIWNLERVRPGMDIARLIPEIPRIKDTNTGALDYNQIGAIRRYTAAMPNGTRVPATVDRLSGEPTFRVSSFPHIAGIMVISPVDLKVSSSNTVFCEALFGQSQPKGKHITDFLPGFDKLLQIMTEEEEIELEDGIVVPEHNFRRTWARMALREGKSEAASSFLKPNGLPALHRDGARLIVDVQMRVVTSEKPMPAAEESVIDEDVESEAAAGNDDMADVQQSTIFSSEELVYALWITYSRQLHTAASAASQVTPLTSFPSSPLHQPSPGQSTTDLHPEEIDADEPKLDAPDVLTLEQKLKEAASEPLTTPTGEKKNGDILRNVTNSEKTCETYGSNTTTTTNHYAINNNSVTTTKKSIQDFTIIEEMGQGAYGQVKLCRHKKPPQRRAVLKYVTKRRILVDTWTRDRRLGTVPLEIHVLDYLRRDGLKHPNIVEMADFFEDDVNYYIEMVPHGLPGMDLFDYIELRVNMTEAECRKIFVQVANALHHLHVKAKVVHRDIKDENVVLDGEGRIKLIDFGSAAYIRNGPFDVFVGTIGKPFFFLLLLSKISRFTFFYHLNVILLFSKIFIS